MVDFLEQFNDSYERVLGQSANRDDFFQDFYLEFLGQSEEIAKKFEKTDLSKQARMLKMSLAYMVNFFVNKKTSDYLDEIAWLHSATQHDIRPVLYDNWMDALLKTVAKRYPRARQLDPNIELAWRIVMAPGIEYMKFNYNRNRMHRPE